MRRSPWLAAALALAVAVAGAQMPEVSGATGQRLVLPPAVANDSALEARTALVASELRCPVCQGLSIQDSPSELSQQMRNLVKEQLAAGRTPEQVKAYFVSKYGEWILLEPNATGFNLLVYLLPVLLVAAGIVTILSLVRRWTAASERDAAVAGPRSRDA